MMHAILIRCLVYGSEYFYDNFQEIMGQGNF